MVLRRIRTLLRVAFNVSIHDASGPWIGGLQIDCRLAKRPLSAVIPALAHVDRETARQIP